MIKTLGERALCGLPFLRLSEVFSLSNVVVQANTLTFWGILDLQMMLETRKVMLESGKDNAEIPNIRGDKKNSIIGELQMTDNRLIPPYTKTLKKPPLDTPINQSTKRIHNQGKKIRRKGDL